MDHEKSSGIVLLDVVSLWTIISWLTSKSREGGLMVHRDVESPGNTTWRKSSCRKFRKNTGTTCKKTCKNYNFVNYGKPTDGSSNNWYSALFKARMPLSWTVNCTKGCRETSICTTKWAKEVGNRQTWNPPMLSLISTSAGGLDSLAWPMTLMRSRGSQISTTRPISTSPPTKILISQLCFSPRSRG